MQVLRPMPQGMLRRRSLRCWILIIQVWRKSGSIATDSNGERHLKPFWSTIAQEKEWLFLVRIQGRRQTRTSFLQKMPSSTPSMCWKILSGIMERISIGNIGRLRILRCACSSIVMDGGPLLQRYTALPEMRNMCVSMCMSSATGSRRILTSLSASISMAQ